MPILPIPTSHRRFAAFSDEGFIAYGTAAARPRAGPSTLNSFYYATDTGVLYVCLFTTSFTWTAVAGTAADNLFDHYTDASTTSVDGTEDDLYSDTLAAGQLASNGDKLDARYVFTLVGHGTATRQVQGYFGGTEIFDAGAFADPSDNTIWVDVSLIRETSSVVRAQTNITYSAAGKQGLPAYTRITGLTLTNTQILKVTGIAAGIGAASGDITAKIGNVFYRAAA